MLGVTKVATKPKARVRVRRMAGLYHKSSTTPNPESPPGKEKWPIEIGHFSKA